MSEVDMRTIHNLKISKDLRKKLRNSATTQEILLWSRLNKTQLGCKFRRQQSIGNYIVDFYCPEKKLIIELDGFQHKEIDKKQYDKERTEFLNELGFKVVRFWNGEINRNIEGVIIRIEKHLS